MVCKFHKYGKTCIEIVGSEDISSGKKKLQVLFTNIHRTPDALYMLSHLFLIVTLLLSPY